MTEPKKPIPRDRIDGLLLRPVRLTPEQIDKARAMGQGNLARGVRTAIEVASVVRTVEGKV